MAGDEHPMRASPAGGEAGGDEESEGVTERAGAKRQRQSQVPEKESEAVGSLTGTFMTVATVPAWEGASVGPSSSKDDDARLLFLRA
jgi:hypothetical protein